MRQGDIIKTEEKKTIKNFIWDSQNKSVSWIYNGKVIKKKFENAYYASVDLQKKYVYIELGQNYYREQVYYFSFDGERIFMADKMSGIVNWLYEDQVIEIDSRNILNAQIYREQGVVILITVPNQTDINIKGFALDGRLLFKKEAPEGYSFMYLSTFKNQPAIVFDGGETNADVHGRSSWYFIVDINTGDMTRENIAY